MNVQLAGRLARLALIPVTVLALTTAAAPAGAATPTCGGVTPPKSTGGTYRCTFSDEFSGSSLDTTKWVPQLTATSGYTSGADACFVNTNKNISVSGGVLNLTARKESSPFTCKNPWGDFNTQYTSGMVTTYGKFSQAYGRFEVRAKMPAATVAGLHSALWLWPQTNKYGAWPGSGEIDIAEVYSQYADRAIPYVHYNDGGLDANVTNNYCMINDVAAFHSYAVEWTTSTIKVIYDGNTCLVDNWNPQGLTKPAPFDQPFVVALTQALGVATNQFDPATTPLPATTSIDYVRVWK